MLEEVAAEDHVDGVRRNVRRQLVARREDLLRARRQRTPGEALDVDGDALAAPDVAQELAKTRPDIEHDIVWFDVALEEMRAEDAPDGVLGVAIGLGKARGVERVETQRMTRSFSMRRIS